MHVVLWLNLGRAHGMSVFPFMNNIGITLFSFSFCIGLVNLEPPFFRPCCHTVEPRLRLITTMIDSIVERLRNFPFNPWLTATGIFVLYHVLRAVSLLYLSPLAVFPGSTWAALGE